MDLPTHFAFGLAIGFVFFGHTPELALVVALGALLPDLDREYWFIPQRKYIEEQPHRALLHNVVVIGATYLVSPFLSLGVFLHVLQDSFTTVKDRGVEWFFPFTRWAKRGRFDQNADEQPLDPNEHVYFYQEDPPRLAKLADKDLQPATNEPVPWRRVYGFAQNSQLLDRGFLVGSIAAFVVWLAIPSPGGSFDNLGFLGSAPLDTYLVWIVGMLAVGLLFLAGETDRRDKHHPFIGRLKPAKYLILLGGLVLLGAWIYLYRASFMTSFLDASSQYLQILTMVFLTPIIAFLLIRWKTKGGKDTAII